MVWCKRRLAYADKARLDGVDGPWQCVYLYGDESCEATPEMGIYTYLNR